MQDYARHRLRCPATSRNCAFEAGTLQQQSQQLRSCAAHASQEDQPSTSGWSLGYWVSSIGPALLYAGFIYYVAALAPNQTPLRDQCALLSTRRTLDCQHLPGGILPPSMHGPVPEACKMCWLQLLYDSSAAVAAFHCRPCRQQYRLCAHGYRTRSTTCTCRLFLERLVGLASEADVRLNHVLFSVFFLMGIHPLNNLDIPKSDMTLCLASPAHLLHNVVCNVCNC